MDFQGVLICTYVDKQIQAFKIDWIPEVKFDVR